METSEKKINISKSGIRQIINFNSAFRSCGHLAEDEENIKDPTGIKVRFSDDEITELDYIMIEPLHVLDIRKNEEKKKNLLDIINKIYKEHVKLVTMDYLYPVYYIRYNKKPIIKLERMIGTGKKHKIYTVKSFVTNFDLIGNREDLIEELRLPNKIDLGNIGNSQEVKIVGLENIIHIKSNNIKYIGYNVEKYHNGELNLKHIVEIGPVFIEKETRISKLILGPETKLNYIYNMFIDTLPNLKEIVLLDWKDKEFKTGLITVKNNTEKQIYEREVDVNYGFKDKDTRYIKITFDNREKANGNESWSSYRV